MLKLKKHVTCLLVIKLLKKFWQSIESSIRELESEHFLQKKIQLLGLLDA